MVAATGAFPVLIYIAREEMLKLMFMQKKS